MLECGSRLPAAKRRVVLEWQPTADNQLQKSEVCSGLGRLLNTPIDQHLMRRMPLRDALSAERGRRGAKNGKTSPSRFLLIHLDISGL